MATMGEISGQDMLIQEWFAFVYGQEGREVAEQVGLVAVEYRIPPPFPQSLWAGRHPPAGTSS